MNTSSAMSYEGYAATMQYNDEGGAFFGRIAGIRDGVGFHGETVAELPAAFHDFVNDYLATCAKAGRSPQKPYSGNVMFRISP